MLTNEEPRKTFTVTFESEGFEDHNEAVYAILQAIHNYEEQIDPTKPIRWVGDQLIED